MDEQKNNFNESSLLTQSKHANHQKAETNSSQNLLKKKTNSNSKKCLSNKDYDKKDHVNLDEIQLKELKSNQDAKEFNNQVKVNIQSDLTSLSSSNKNRKKICNLKKINMAAIKRPLPCLFAWSLLLSSTGAYYSIVAPRLLELLDDLFYWAIILTLQTILFLYVIINFLIAIFRDPGRFQKYIIPSDDPNFNDDTKSPLYKTVTIKKTTVKIKWCSTCNFYRPPRVSHCSICDACIDQFDHHCPWLNNCVGKRNYRFFFQFLGFLCLHMCAIFSCCLYVVTKTIPLISPSVISSACLIVIIFLLIFPIGGLFIFHIILVSKGRTTNEHVTGKYKGMNFFSRGCCQNFFYLFCGSLIPRYRSVKIKPKSKNKKIDVESGEYDQKLKANSISSDEYSNDKDNQRLTVSYSNNKLNNAQEPELLDLVLKNKKNRSKSSISSDSSISSSMLNQDTRVNTVNNNVSIDSKRLSTRISELNNTSLTSNNIK